MAARMLASKPFGHEHRVNLAKHRPESTPLRPCDLSCLLSLSVSAVHERDAQLRPAMLGLGARKTRRYSWAKYLAYLAIVDGPGDAASD